MDPTTEAAPAAAEDDRAADGGSVSGLPTPPATATTRRERRRQRRRQLRHRPGHLSPGWATALGCTWLLAVVALAGVWVSSRTTGMSTWWLGPEARPASAFVTALPYVLPMFAALAAFGVTRYAPWDGVVASLATAAIGLGDLGRVTTYGVIELTVAAATLLVSIASFAGVYRAAAPTSDAGAATGEADPER